MQFLPEAFRLFGKSPYGNFPAALPQKMFFQFVKSLPEGKIHSGCGIPELAGKIACGNSGLREMVEKTFPLRFHPVGDSAPENGIYAKSADFPETFLLRIQIDPEIVRQALMARQRSENSGKQSIVILTIIKMIPVPEADADQRKNPVC